MNFVESFFVADAASGGEKSFYLLQRKPKLITVKTSLKLTT